MHLLKCENGHIYDTDKFRSCPHCSSIEIDRFVDADTFGENQADVDTEIPELEQQAHYERISKRKTVGMLLCVEGAMAGDGFFLREGENVIGRASNMDVALTKDVTISRKNHVSIYYDMEKDTYTMQVRNDSVMVLWNGKQITKDKCIKHGDEIQLGACKLILVEAGKLWKGYMGSKA